MAEREEELKKLKDWVNTLNNLPSEFLEKGRPLKEMVDVRTNLYMAREGMTIEVSEKTWYMKSDNDKYILHCLIRDNGRLTFSYLVVDEYILHRILHLLANTGKGSFKIVSRIGADNEQYLDVEPT